MDFYYAPLTNGYKLFYIRSVNIFTIRFGAKRCLNFPNQSSHWGFLISYLEWG